MIVLAIAGLILLIVLLAVPALNRNAKNTTVKNDASAVVAGIQEFKANNDGAPPTAVTTTQVTGAASTNPVNIKINGTTGVSSTSTPGQFAIGYQAGTNCAGTSVANAMSVYYTIDSGGGGNATKCLDA